MPKINVRYVLPVVVFASILSACPGGVELKTPPRIVGELREGEVLRLESATWDREGTPEMKTRWQRCMSSNPFSIDRAPMPSPAPGANLSCVEIPEATALEYRLSGVDLGMHVRAQQTALFDNESVSALSENVGPIGHGPPFNLEPPYWEGTAMLWQALIINRGTWTIDNHGMIQVEILRCDAAGENCLQPGADQPVGAFYRQLTVADIGSRFRARITLTDEEYSTTVVSAPSDVVVASPPVALGNAYVGADGGFQEGRTAWLDGDHFTAGPSLVRAYQWLRCDAAGQNCFEISNAIGRTLVISSADSGKSLRVRITAMDEFGTTVTETPASPVVEAGPPEYDVLPAISGTEAVGETLTGSIGEWSATGTIHYSHHWQRCTADCVTCNALAGQTSSTYRVQAADSGSALRFAVTASIDMQATTATSACTAVIP